MNCVIICPRSLLWTPSFLDSFMYLSCRLDSRGAVEGWELRLQIIPLVPQVTCSWVPMNLNHLNHPKSRSSAPLSRPQEMPLQILIAVLFSLTDAWWNQGTKHGHWDITQLEFKMVFHTSPNFFHESATCASHQICAFLGVDFLFHCRVLFLFVHVLFFGLVGIGVQIFHLQHHGWGYHHGDCWSTCSHHRSIPSWCFLGDARSAWRKNWWCLRTNMNISYEYEYEYESISFLITTI